jgi:HEPN domain-containing protein
VSIEAKLGMPPWTADFRSLLVDAIYIELAEEMAQFHIEERIKLSRYESIELATEGLCCPARAVFLSIQRMSPVVDARV